MRQIKTSSSEHQKSVEKTEAILAGAMQEFLDRGYAATIDRIARAPRIFKVTSRGNKQLEMRTGVGC
ncbi:MAG: hypothetical protein QNJ36_04595 [Calothrix sp. MO_167.B42]|nr:hypothetical protein [Calothrix sp. MO_167.B42]